MKSLLIVITWFAASLTTLGISLWAYTKVGQPHVLGISTESRSRLAYAALPNIVSELQTTIKTQDARPIVIENYLKRFNSPMAGNGEYIVKKANELGTAHNIDPTYLAYLTIAIAQNESNLGKVMPPDCYNAWGYGIHSRGTLCFSSWKEGIDRFMTGVASDFIDKRKLETPEQIMTRYTPTSPDGAWAKGVDQFLDELYSGKI